MRLAAAAAVVVWGWAGAAVTPVALGDSCGGITVRAGDGAFVDGCGRQRMFRGLNVIYKAAPWAPIVDHFDPFLSMAPADAALWQR
jgi:hypothetical protein